MKKEAVFIGILLILCLLSIIIGASLISKGKEKKIQPFEERGIAIINIYGSIETTSQPGGFFEGFKGADYITKRLSRIAKDKRIKALVVRIDSPGGSVAASQEIYKGILSLKKNGKKVIISMADLACSGAYYIACAGDKIIADEGSIIGSIGVIFFAPNIESLMEKIGVKFNVIKSGKHKDIGSIAREMTDEEKKIIQGLIDKTFLQFFNAVSRERKIKEDRLKEIADGRVFIGEEAKKIGLIDEIGTFQDAIKEAARLSGIKGEPKIIDEREPMERIMEEFLNITRGIKPKIDTSSKLKYIWQPGL
ncbi:MAG: signal peptide peptidase SppA [bacterium]